MNLTELDNYDLESKLINSAMDGDINIVGEIINLGKLQDCIHNAYKIACEHGNLDLVKYLINSSDLKEKLDINAYDHISFRRACEYGHIEVVEFLYPLLKFENKKKNNGLAIAIKGACVRENFNIIKYLLTQPETYLYIDIKYHGYDWLEACCSKGNLEIIKYLMTSKDLKENIEVIPENMFDTALLACFKENYLNVVEYLLASPDLNKHANIHTQNDYIFEFLYEKENIDTIKWLILEMNIKRTDNIGYVLLDNPNEEIENCFKIKEISDSLKNELVNNEIKSKKSKI